MKRISLIIGLLALMASSATAREWRVTIAGGGTAVSDGGFLALMDSNWMVGGDLGFQVEAVEGLLIGPRVRLAHTAGDDVFVHSSAVDSSTVEMLAVIRYQIAVAQWFRPFVELEGGSTRTLIRIGGARAEAWGGVVSGLAGVEFRTRPGMLSEGNFGFGVELAGGYIYRSDLDMTAGDVKLGRLQLSGGLFRIAASVIF